LREPGYGGKAFLLPEPEVWLSQTMVIRLKRVYDPSSEEDGERFLVDRLWPRGVSRERLGIVAWAREAAPSSGLRIWYGHDPSKWAEFRERYFRELEGRPEAWKPLLEAAEKGTITLLFSSREPRINNAVALKEYLEARLPVRR